MKSILSGELFTIEIALIRAPLDSDPGEQENIIAKHSDLFWSLKQEMLEWYNEIWNEEKPFPRPRFYIGMNNSSRSKVNAFGVSRLLGKSSNTSHYLNQLCYIGDGAEWDVEVLNSGTYSLEIDHMDDQFPAGMVLKVSIGESQKEFVVGNNRMFYAGLWDLSEGPSSIRIEVVSNPTLYLESLDRIRHLTFHQVSSPRDESQYPW